MTSSIDAVPLASTAEHTEMTAKFEGTPFPWSEKRRSGRHEVRAAVRISYAEIAAGSGVMTDISEYGCRIEARSRMTTGRLVSLEVGDFTVVGWVAWSTQEAFGVDFSNPLRLEVVHHIAEVVSRR